MKKNNKKGFTLVELVIVVAVMAILVAVAIPTVRSITGTASDAVDNTNAQTVESVVKLWLAEAEVNGATAAADMDTALANAQLGIENKYFEYNKTTGAVSPVETKPAAASADTNIVYILFEKASGATTVTVSTLPADVSATTAG